MRNFVPFKISKAKVLCNEKTGSTVCESLNSPPEADTYTFAPNAFHEILELSAELHPFELNCIFLN